MNLLEYKVISSIAGSGEKEDLIKRSCTQQAMTDGGQPEGNCSVGTE